MTREEMRDVALRALEAMHRLDDEGYEIVRDLLQVIAELSRPDAERQESRR